MPQHKCVMRQFLCLSVGQKHLITDPKQIKSIILYSVTDVEDCMTIAQYYDTQTFTIAILDLEAISHEDTKPKVMTRTPVIWHNG